MVSKTVSSSGSCLDNFCSTSSSTFFRCRSWSLTFSVWVLTIQLDQSTHLEDDCACSRIWTPNLCRKLWMKPTDRNLNLDPGIGADSCGYPGDVRSENKPLGPKLLNLPTSHCKTFRAFAKDRHLIATLFHEVWGLLQQLFTGFLAVSESLCHQSQLTWRW